jgi:hypothetical protein
VEPIDAAEGWETPPFDPERIRCFLWLPGEMPMIGPDEEEWPEAPEAEERRCE